MHGSTIDAECEPRALGGPDEKEKPLGANIGHAQRDQEKPKLHIIEIAILACEVSGPPFLGEITQAHLMSLHTGHLVHPMLRPLQLYLPQRSRSNICCFPPTPETRTKSQKSYASNNPPGVHEEPYQERIRYTEYHSWSREGSSRAPGGVSSPGSEMPINCVKQPIVGLPPYLNNDVVTHHCPISHKDVPRDAFVSSKHPYFHVCSGSVPTSFNRPSTLFPGGSHRDHSRGFQGGN